MVDSRAAYWVDPKGKILRLTEPLHITQILHNPEKFGEKEKDLRALYVKNKEKYGSEGKTRDEVMRRVLKKGFIRVRLYTGGGDYWSVTLERFGRNEKKALQVWAKDAAKNKVVGKYADVKIVELSRDKVHEYEVDDLVKGDHLYEHEIPTNDGYLPEVVSLDDFGYEPNVISKVLHTLK